MFRVDPSPPLPKTSAAEPNARRFDENLARALTSYLGFMAQRLNNVLPTDGSEAMTGDLDMGLFDIVNVQDITGTGTSLWIANYLRLTSTTAVTTGSTGHAFQIGASGTTNLAMSPAAIMARSNGSTSTLTINGSGGSVALGGLLDLSSANAGQISFPASQNLSAGANILDDYEEGTFTPTILASGGGAGTYTVQQGHYTKIGQTVFYNAWVTWTAHSGSGTIKIAGLPFTSNAAPSVNPTGVVVSGGLALPNPIYPYVESGATTVMLGTVALASGAYTLLALDTAASVGVNGHYRI